MVDRCAFSVKMLVKSRADSTAKMNLVEIRRFLDWCKRNSETESYPFSSTVVTLSLFQLFANQHKSYEVLVIMHTALKWFHSFVPINGQNPLDDACAKNVIESAKRTKGNPIVKKEPISTDLIKKKIDKFAADGASLKDLRTGGITLVVNNNDFKIISERLLKLHGRWKTDVAKDMYVKEADSSR